MASRLPMPSCGLAATDAEKGRMSFEWAERAFGFNAGAHSVTGWTFGGEA